MKKLVILMMAATGVSCGGPTAEPPPRTCSASTGAIATTAVPVCPGTGNDPTAPEFRITGLVISAPAPLASPLIRSLINSAIGESRLNWLIQFNTTTGAFTTGSATETAMGSGMYTFEAAPYAPATTTATLTVETFATGAGPLDIRVPVRETVGGPVIVELPLHEADMSGTMSSNRDCVGAQYGTAATSPWCADEGTIHAKITFAEAMGVPITAASTTLCNLLCGSDCTMTMPASCMLAPDTTVFDPMTMMDVPAWTITAGYSAVATVIP